MRFKGTAFVLPVAVILFAGAFVVGCSEENDRKPTAAEGQAADTKRQQYIDSLNIPADQKARMKAQMGGPSVANPADAARKGEKPANAQDRK